MDGRGESSVRQAEGGRDYGPIPAGTGDAAEPSVTGRREGKDGP